MWPGRVCCSFAGMIVGHGPAGAARRSAVLGQWVGVGQGCRWGVVDRCSCPAARPPPADGLISIQCDHQELSPATWAVRLSCAVQPRQHAARDSCTGQGRSCTQIPAQAQGWHIKSPGVGLAPAPNHNSCMHGASRCTHADKTLPCGAQHVGATLTRRQGVSTTDRGRFSGMVCCRTSPHLDCPGLIRACACAKGTRDLWHCLL